MPVMTTSRALMRRQGEPSSRLRRRLGRDQLVDLGAQVLHEEVLFGRDLAVIDVLRPLFQRHLDAEFLVDGKDDVEEIEAVDAEIVDRVAFRCDGVASISLVSAMIFATFSNVVDKTIFPRTTGRIRG